MDETIKNYNNILLNVTKASSNEVIYSSNNIYLRKIKQNIYDNKSSEYIEIDLNDKVLINNKKK